VGECDYYRDDNGKRVNDEIVVEDKRETGVGERAICVTRSILRVLLGEREFLLGGGKRA
jgi:hypothetical protein